MTIAEEIAADLSEVIGESPVTVTRADSSTFQARSSSTLDERSFVDGGEEYQVERTLLCAAADVTTLSPKDKVTISSRAFRILSKEVDQQGVGVTLILGSPTKR